MLTIRLSRTGKRHKPQYRIVVQEKQHDPWSPALEVVGHYNPHTKPSTIELKEDRIKEWLAKGAQPSNTVHNMLINAGLIKADKAKSVAISNKRSAKMTEKKAEAENKAAEAAAAKAEAEAAAAAAPAEEAPAEEKPAEEPKEETTEEKKDETSEEVPAEEKTE